MTAAFTPDGRWVLSASDDGTARVWDCADRQAGHATPDDLKGNPMSVAVTPDGKHAVVGGFMDALAVLDLGDLARTDDVDPDALCLRAELLAGQRLHEGGGTVNLSADEWLDRWRAFRRQSPAPRLADRSRLRPERSMRQVPTRAPASARRSGWTTCRPVSARRPTCSAPAGSTRRSQRAGSWSPSSSGRSIESPDDPSLRHRLALALVLAGDREGYRRACAATLERFGRSQDALIGEAARACLVGPDAVDDPSVPRRLAETALAREPGAPWLHYVLGLADFRAGRYEAAVEHLGESLKSGADWAAAPLNYPVLAMAYHRLGRKDEARRWLEKAHGRRR